MDKILILDFGSQYTQLIARRVREMHVYSELLLHSEEIAKLIGKVERSGYTLVPIDMHFKGGRIKIEIGLAKGKKQYDKRNAEKERDWERDKARIMRAANKK